MDVYFDSDFAFTGSRDGSIIKSHIVDQEYSKVFTSDPKQMITCLKYDDVNLKLWYGTPDSSVQCLDMGKKLTHVNGFHKDVGIANNQNLLYYKHMEIKGKLNSVYYIERPTLDN